MKIKKGVCLMLVAVLALALFGCSPIKEYGDKATDLEGLKGKVVFNIGEGSPPDLTFRYILKARGIEYAKGATAVEGKVMLGYVADSAAARAKLEAGQANYVIAAEPSVSPILASLEGSKQLFDLQAEYNKATNTTDSFVQSCLVVKTKFLSENPDTVAAICEALKGSTTWAADNIEAAKTALKTAGSKTMDSLTKDSVLRSSVVYKDAFANKASIETYFNNIAGVTIGDEPNPIGKMPDEKFYAKDYLNGSTTSETAVKFYAPDGSPCLAIAKLIADGNDGKIKNATINIVPGSEIGTNVKKNADMAIMPINAAANLYSKDTPIQILAITTTGSLYMLTK